MTLPIAIQNNKVDYIMKVSELIAHLQSMDPELEVYLSDCFDHPEFQAVKHDTISEWKTPNRFERPSVSST